jgi:hypothetical protein
MLQLQELTGTQVHTELHAQVPPVLPPPPAGGFSPGCIIYTSLSGIFRVTDLFIWGSVPISFPVAAILSLGRITFFISEMI